MWLSIVKIGCSQLFTMATHANSSQTKFKLILKTIGNRKGDCAWSCSRWQTQPEKICKSQRTNQCHSLCTLYWFVLCNLQIFSGCVCHLKQLHAQINLFASRAVKRERRKGSSRRQQPAYGAAVNEVARELLRSARSLKRENGGRRYIKHDGMIASPVGSCLCCWQLPLSPPVPPLYCSAPHCPSLSPTRFDAFKDVIVWIVHNMLPILSEQPRHLGYRPVYVGFPYDL